MIPCNIIKYNTVSRRGFISHVCQNLFYYSCCTFLVQQKAHKSIKQLSKTLLVVYIKG
uniref:Uncharacterized protein n=1 Tax=Arundo donax TaxID=35708 RepID=A0A0A9DSL8_ARUDO